jgi:chromosome segregation ATPase
MERDELKKDIETMVADIWSEKEEVEVRKKTEEALQKSADVITELTDSIGDKDAEIAEVVGKVTASEDRIKELETELEAASKELEKSKDALAVSEKVVDEMTKDKAASIRMAELAEAGVVHSDVDTQTSRVKEMSEEDFAFYRDELVSLKKAVEDKLVADAKIAKDAADEKAAADNGEETNEGGDVLAAQIDPDNAAQAALNLESPPGEEVSAQYQEMGKAMAALWKNKEK